MSIHSASYLALLLKVIFVCGFGHKVTFVGHKVKFVGHKLTLAVVIIREHLVPSEIVDN
jgi:hypothetical protein